MSNGFFHTCSDFSMTLPILDKWHKTNAVVILEAFFFFLFSTENLSMLNLHNWVYSLKNVYVYIYIYILERISTYGDWNPQKINK